MVRKTMIRMINRLIGRLNSDDLIKRGLKVGSGCSFQEGVKIDDSHCWLIEIGNNVTIAPNVQIIAHDASTKRLLGYTRIGKIKIEDNVFVGAGTIVLPNVTIGTNCIIGAGSLVSRDIPANVVAAGNPARVIGSLEEFLIKHRRGMSIFPVFERKYTLANNVSTMMKTEMIEKMIKGQGYVV